LPHSIILNQFFLTQKANEQKLNKQNNYTCKKTNIKFSELAIRTCSPTPSTQLKLLHLPSPFRLLVFLNSRFLLVFTNLYPWVRRCPQREHWCARCIWLNSWEDKGLGKVLTTEAISLSPRICSSEDRICPAKSGFSLSRMEQRQPDLMVLHETRNCWKRILIKSVSLLCF